MKTSCLAFIWELRKGKLHTALHLERDRLARRWRLVLRMTFCTDRRSLLVALGALCVLGALGDLRNLPAALGALGDLGDRRNLPGALGDLGALGDRDTEREADCKCLASSAACLAAARCIDRPNGPE